MNRLCMVPMATLVMGASLTMACGKSGGDTHEAAKAVEPFKGPLTVAKVMEAKGLMKPLDTWDAAFARLQGVVGAPTKVDGDKHFWAAMEGEDCAYFEVRREDGKQYNAKGLVVGTTSDPRTVAKGGPIMNRAECLTLVGKGMAAEDPNAEGPRADGAPYAVGEVAALAVGGRSKWKGQTVKVTGKPTQMMGDEALLRDPADENVKITCKLAAGTPPPKLGEPVTMQGTVEIREFVRGDGTPGMDASLVGCTVAKN